MDPREPATRACADDRSRNRGQRVLPGRLWPRPGPRRREAASRAGAVRAGCQRSRGTAALTPEGWRHRLPVHVTGCWPMPGSCRCPGHIPGATGLGTRWQTWSRGRRSHERRHGGVVILLRAVVPWVGPPGTVLWAAAKPLTAWTRSGRGTAAGTTGGRAGPADRFAAAVARALTRRAWRA